jgi:hypothetical protein
MLSPLTSVNKEKKKKKNGAHEYCVKMQPNAEFVPGLSPCHTISANQHSYSSPNPYIAFTWNSLVAFFV